MTSLHEDIDCHEAGAYFHVEATQAGQVDGTQWIRPIRDQWVTDMPDIEITSALVTDNAFGANPD